MLKRCFEEVKPFSHDRKIGLSYAVMWSTFAPCRISIRTTSSNTCDVAVCRALPMSSLLKPRWRGSLRNICILIETAVENGDAVTVVKLKSERVELLVA